MRNKDTILLEKALEKVTKVVNEFHNEDEGYSVEDQFHKLVESEESVIEALNLASHFFKLKSLVNGFGLSEETKRHYSDVASTLKHEANHFAANIKI